MAQELLSDSIDAYERWRRSMDIAPNTLKQQRTSMKRFLLVTGNVYTHMLSDHHVTRFFEDLAKTKSPNSMRNDHTFLEGFFEWARRTKRMSLDNDPMYGRKAPKKRHRERSRIHVSKFPALLDAAGKRSPRDRAMIALLLYTLGRDQEIATIRMKDVDLEGGYLKVVVHKSKTEDRIPICSELDYELRQWLTAYTLDVGHLEPHYFLVPTRMTMRERDEATNRIVAHHHVSYKPEAKIPALARYVTPVLADIGFPVVGMDGKSLGEGAHTIRRSGARALFDRLAEQGYDRALRIVQSMLHHTSVSITEQYLGITADRRSRDEILRGQPMYALPEVREIHAAG